MTLMIHWFRLRPSCGFGGWLDGHFVAELGDLADEAPDFRFGESAVEIIGAEVLVGGSVAEHVIDGGEDRGGHGADRLLRAASGFQAQELRPVVAGFGVLGLPTRTGRARTSTTGCPCAVGCHPCIPRTWATFEMTVRRQSARYEITVDNPAGVNRGIRFAELDGVEIVERPLRLRIVDDSAVHRV